MLPGSHWLQSQEWGPLALSFSAKWIFSKEVQITSTLISATVIKKLLSISFSLSWKKFNCEVGDGHKQRISVSTSHLKPGVPVGEARKAGTSRTAGSGQSIPGPQEGGDSEVSADPWCSRHPQPLTPQQMTSKRVHRTHCSARVPEKGGLPWEEPCPPSTPPLPPLIYLPGVSAQGHLLGVEIVLPGVPSPPPDAPESPLPSLQCPPGAVITVWKNYCHWSQSQEDSWWMAISFTPFPFKPLELSPFPACSAATILPEWGFFRGLGTPAGGSGQTEGGAGGKVGKWVTVLVARSCQTPLRPHGL